MEKAPLRSGIASFSRRSESYSEGHHVFILECHAHGGYYHRRGAGRTAISWRGERDGQYCEGVSSRVARGIAYPLRTPGGWERDRRCSTLYCACSDGCQQAASQQKGEWKLATPLDVEFFQVGDMPMETEPRITLEVNTSLGPPLLFSCSIEHAQQLASLLNDAVQKASKDQRTKFPYRSKLGSSPHQTL
jgi:hypothetical protein